MANRATIVMEVVEGGIDDDLKIPSERFHSSVLLLITTIGLTRYAGVATLATVSISPGESAISIRGFL
jgi:hypothetical protein